MRVSSSAAVRSNAGYEARSFGASSAGSGMLQCTSSRVRRELRADLPDAVAQRDHHVEALRDELVEVLGAVRADVDPALLHDPHRVRDAAASGGCPRSRPRSPLPTSCSRSASAICERALLPVHRNRTRRPATPSALGRGGRRRRGHEPQPGMQRAARRLQLLPAAERGRSRSSASRPIGRAARVRHEPAVAELAQVVRDEALRLAEELRQLTTARSLCTSSRSSRQRTGLRSRRTKPGGPAGVRCDPTVAGTAATLPPIPLSHQARLMYLRQPEHACVRGGTSEHVDCPRWRSGVVPVPAIPVRCRVIPAYAVVSASGRRASIAMSGKRGTKRAGSGRVHGSGELNRGSGSEESLMSTEVISQPWIARRGRRKWRWGVLATVRGGRVSPVPWWLPCRLAGRRAGIR